MEWWLIEADLPTIPKNKQGIPLSPTTTIQEDPGTASGKDSTQILDAISDVNWKPYASLTSKIG